MPNAKKSAGAKAKGCLTGRFRRRRDAVHIAYDVKGKNVPSDFHRQVDTQDFVFTGFAGAGSTRGILAGVYRQVQRIFQNESFRSVSNGKESEDGNK